MNIGHMLIESGAEIYRVEESITRMLRAYGIQRVEVFALPTLILVSIETENQTTITKSERVPFRSPNFDRIGRLNDLVRRICILRPDYETVVNQMGYINNNKPFPFPVILAGFFFSVFSFSLLVNASIYSALVAGLATIVAQLVCHQMERFHSNSFFITIVASFIHTTVGAAFVAAFPVLELDKIIIATLITILPGLTFTTAIRDLIARDLLAGVIAGLEALLIAAAIAIGNAVSYFIFAEIWKVF